MLNTLPLEILIQIVNFLEIKDVYSLMKLKNPIISSACQEIKKIFLNVYHSKNFYRDLIYFNNVKELTVCNNRIRKNAIIYSILLKNWQLKKLEFNSARFLKYDVIKRLFKHQNKLETLRLQSCWELNSEHFKLLNKNIKNLYLSNHNIDTEV